MNERKILPSVEEPIELGDYLGVIRKRFVVIILIFLIVFFTTVWLTYTQPTIYQAATYIEVTKDLSLTVLPGDMIPLRDIWGDMIHFETQKHMIQTDSVIGGVVTKLKLADSQKEKDKFDAEVARIKGSITVERKEGTRIFMIKARTTERKTAIDIANATANVYIAWTRQRRLETALKSTSWVEEQIVEIEHKLKQAEQTLIDFIKEARITDMKSFEMNADVPRRFPVEDGETKMHLQRLRDQRNEAELKLSQYALKYREKHPKMIEVRRTIAVLTQKITQEEDEIIKNKQNLLQYYLLKGDRDAKQNLYTSLVKQRNQVDLTGAIKESDVQIIELAKQAMKVAPNEEKNLLLGGLCGLVLGIGAAFLLEFLDITVRSPAEIEKFLNVQVLASIPKSKFANRPRSKEIKDPVSLITYLDPKSVEAEMFKTLRTNIRFSRFGKKLKSFLVTSSNPEEGKTMIVSNLGISMAYSKLKTLLLDTDLRKPKLHTTFNLENKTGITEVLTEKIDLENAIQSSGIDNLDIITSGTLPSNPVELLESPLMRETLSKLAETYDHLILDSPPAGSIIDASILGSLVEGILFVIHSERLNKRFVRQTIHQLEKVESTIYGVIINNVDIKRMSPYYYYYYGKYYGKYHSKYYAQENDA